MRKAVPASLAYGLLVFLVLPAGVAALNDDFGYLRSVVETVRHSRPWTDDWLEPWSAGLSSLSALLYATIGSFRAATHGLLAGLAAASFFATTGLLRARGLTEARALATAAMVLTFPTLFWKSVEFTGLALYVPCLLFALWSAESRRWGWFLAAWGLALATRQSALAWILLPTYAAIRAWTYGAKPGSAGNRWTPILAAATGFGLFFVLSRAMNKTHAQLVLTDHVFERIDARRVPQVFLIGSAVFLLASGLGALVLRLGSIASAAPARPSRVAGGIVALAAIALLWLDVRDLVGLDHAGFAGAAGWTYSKAILLLALAGWLRGGLPLRVDHALCALGCLAVVCLRADVWDYYFVDVAALGFFGVRPRAEAGRQAHAAATLSRAGAVALGVLALVHLSIVLQFKAAMDRGFALGELGERALRAGRIAPDELSFVPFGFVGWHLYPHFATNEGRTDLNLAGFLGYLRGGTVDVGQGYSRPLHLLPTYRHEPPADRSALIGYHSFRILWFFRGELFLLRAAPERVTPAARPLEIAREDLPVFPLDDAEWRKLISGHAVSGQLRPK